jgi:Fic family protein
MEAFLAWFEKPRAIDGILHAAIAHLWFVTIHPFDDGNGRIARALADMSLAWSENSPHRFYRLARNEGGSKNASYRIAETVDRSNEG